jgi:hypothetical protein
MAKLYNLARMTTATTGTGTITLGAAVSGYLSFSQSGVADGTTVSYGINDGANSEVGTGVYTASGTTLTRTITKSTNSNAAINLSGTAQVFITPRAEDIANLTTANAFTDTTASTNTSSGALTTAGGLGVAGAIHAGLALFADGALASAPSLDASDNTYSLGAGASYTLAYSGSGLLIVGENSTGAMAVFALGGGVVTLIGQAGSTWSASSTPAAWGVYYNGANYAVKNGTGATQSFCAAFIRVRPNN